MATSGRDTDDVMENIQDTETQSLEHISQEKLDSQLSKDQMDESDMAADADNTVLDPTAEEDIGSAVYPVVSEDSLAPTPLKLTLLFISGIRSPLCIDKPFITFHSLHVKEADSIPVGVLKTCLYDSWNEEWGTRPSSALKIRLIHFGKVLDDSQTLEEYKILSSNRDNVVHISVKPDSFDMESPKTGASSRGRRSDPNNPRSSPSCCIIF